MAYLVGPASTLATVAKEEAAFLAALGILVFVVAPAFVLLLDRRAFSGRKPEDSSGPPLPESLREVVLLGRRYFVHWECGLVLDQEAEFVQWGHLMFDHADRIQTRPPIPAIVALFVLLPHGRTHTWVFPNASRQAQANDVVSGLFWIRCDNTEEFFLSFNHTTGKSEVLPGLTGANRARKFLAFIATSLGGAVTFHLVTGTWTYSLGMAVVASAIVVPLSATAITATR